jgi:hypothetical protein
MAKRAIPLGLGLALMFAIQVCHASDLVPRNDRDCYGLVADALHISSLWERGAKRLEVQNAISLGLDRPSREQLEMLVVEGYERLQRGTAAVDWVDSVEKRCLSGELSAPLPTAGAV